MSTRRGRRRRERQRAKRPPRGKQLSHATRAALVGAGLLAIIGGAVLLGAGGAGNAARLGRVAGILIIIGFVAIGAAAIGRI